MRNLKKCTTLEEDILRLQQEAKHKSISIQDILRILPGKGQVLALVFLSFPFCQPIQIPGLSLPFGLAIALIGMRIALGKHIWLPKRILAKTIKPSTIQKITNKALWVIHKIRPWIRPRLNRVCHCSYMHIIHGATIFLLGAFLALPLPIPLSNIIVAWSICLMALGLLEDDGIFVLFGYFLSLLTIAFFTGLIVSINYVL